MAGQATIKAFFELVRAGLWQRCAGQLPCEGLDMEELFELSQRQFVIGLVAAGFELIADERMSEADVKPFTEAAVDIEQRNLAMNYFIGVMVEKMREAGIVPVLVKGQGLAQCYERPLWRAAGDVDFLFHGDDYTKAVQLLVPLSSDQKQEGRYSRHFGLVIGPWYTELHGTLRSCLSSGIDREIDAVQDDCFVNRRFRIWQNDQVDVLLPGADNDVFFVFSHFIKHFYKEEGVCLRQVCDWCRLLWVLGDSIDSKALETHLNRSGLLAEWKSFAALAVEYLGMPSTAIPLYDSDEKWRKKAKLILEFELGKRSECNILNIFFFLKVFPSNTIRFLPGILFELTYMKILDRFKR